MIAPTLELVSRRIHRRLEQRAQQRILHVLDDYPLDGCGGYAISRLARVNPGRMYPILARLEGNGVVESWWGSEARPRRRRYRLVSYANGAPK